MKKNEAIKRKKNDIKVGDLVIVRSGKWKGIKDYIFSINSKKRVVYLKKVSTEIFEKHPEKKETSNKKRVFRALSFCKITLL